MQINQTPFLDQTKAETGCCPRFNTKEWDEKEFVFESKRFIKGGTLSFMHIPLNMSSMMKKNWGLVEDAGADSNEFIMLSYDPSPWRGEHYLSVTKEVPGAENVKLSGTFVAKVFEGPYKETNQWVAQMKEYIESRDMETKKLYFYYTTCPKCAKHFGENYVVGFAQV